MVAKQCHKVSVLRQAAHATELERHLIQAHTYASIILFRWRCEHAHFWFRLCRSRHPAGPCACLCNKRQRRIRTVTSDELRQKLVTRHLSLITCHCFLTATSRRPLSVRRANVLGRQRRASAGSVHPPVRDSGEMSNGDREERRVGKECRSRWSPYH